MSKQPTRTWSLVLSLGIPLGIVGVAAMMITFATLIDVAKINGLPFPEVFPIVVDVGMVASMITAAQFRLRGVDGRWLAYLAFIVLSLVSVVANGTHALQTADMERTTPWAASLIGAVPSATLLVITHLVMKLIPDDRERAKLQAQREKSQARVAVRQPAEVTPAPQEPAASVTEASKPAPAPREVSVAPTTVKVSDEEVRARVLDHLFETGQRPTGATVGEWLGGKSAKTGQRFMLKMEEQGLFDTPAPQLVAVGQ